MGDIARRLERVRQAVLARSGNVGGVLVLLDGETGEEAVARAAAAGRRGPFLVVPAPVDEATWEAQTARQQAALLVEAALHIQGLVAHPQAAFSVGR